MLALAAAAFALSYPGARDTALSAGVSPDLARIYPGIFDAVLLVACAGALTLRGVLRGYAWLVIIVVIGTVATTDAVRALSVALPKRPMEATVAVLPWAVLLIGFTLLYAMVWQGWPGRKAAADPAGHPTNGAGPRKDATVVPLSELLVVKPGAPAGQGKAPTAAAQPGAPTPATGDNGPAKTPALPTVNADTIKTAVTTPARTEKTGPPTDKTSPGKTSTGKTSTDGAAEPSAAKATTDKASAAKAGTTQTSTTQTNAKADTAVADAGKTATSVTPKTATSDAAPATTPASSTGAPSTGAPSTGALSTGVSDTATVSPDTITGSGSATAATPTAPDSGPGTPSANPPATSGPGTTAPATAGLSEPLPMRSAPGRDEPSDADAEPVEPGSHFTRLRSSPTPPGDEE